MSQPFFRHLTRRTFLATTITTVGLRRLARAADVEALPQTKPLALEGDLAAQMVAGIDKYLMRELADSVGKRKELWKPDDTSVATYMKSVQPNRERLKKILGVVDQRVPFTDLEYVGGPKTPALVAETDLYQVHAVRWPVLAGVDGDGLLLEPKGKVIAQVVALPDADWTAEMFAGLAPGVDDMGHVPRRLAENGYRVLVPTLINRKDDYSGSAALNRWTNQPHREFIYRMAFEMGRHIIGYEVQKVLAAVDWFTREKGHPPVGVVGYGEGGRIALYASAVDEVLTDPPPGFQALPRIRATGVCGAFAAREDVWKEPIYRNVWGQLREFGDAELFHLVAAARFLGLQDCAWPEVSGPPPAREGRSGAAPGRLTTPLANVVGGEFERRPGFPMFMATSGANLWSAGRDKPVPDAYGLIDIVVQVEKKQRAGPVPKDTRKDFDPNVRQKRQFDQLVDFTQKLMRDSEHRRRDTFWAKLDLSSLDKYQASCKAFRDQFWEEVIGKLPAPTVPINPRTRQAYDEPKWKGYEVVLDLYPDVYAYGVLLVPKDLKQGEKRPVVVCQHGLEGKPQDVVKPKEKTRAYNSFGAQLADRGYVVFAPQNPYIGKDNFRVLQRKANPLALSLFSFIVRQHERILDWLATLPYVDDKRIGFYGLSYGGKTAMRVPAILERYCLSICSGDFNEWIWKNVSVDFRGSYMFTGEYEMFEFNLGHTFNYAEMAALIAPRPFMVERGHDDGVGIDEWVAYEYAKVRRLYAKLGIPERTALEFFNGGHVINGQGTFEFLAKHLKWPAK